MRERLGPLQENLRFVQLAAHREATGVLVAKEEEEATLVGRGVVRGKD